MAEFIDGAKLKQELTEWKKEWTKAPEGRKPRLNDFIGHSIITMANRYSMKPGFFQYTFREEMVGDAIECCCRYLHNYSPKKGESAFAYITMMIHNAFVRRIEREQKHSYVWAKLLDSRDFAVVNQDSDDKDYRMKVLDGADADAPHRQIIDRFESKMQRKRERTEATKAAKVSGKPAKRKAPTAKRPLRRRVA